MREAVSVHGQVAILVELRQILRQIVRRKDSENTSRLRPILLKTHILQPLGNAC